MAKRAGLGLPFSADHGRVDVDEREPGIPGAPFPDGGVGLAHFSHQVPALEAGLDGDKSDARLRQLGVHQPGELPVVGEHALGRLARCDVVVLGVKDNRPGPVGKHDACDVVNAVRNLGSTEAAIEKVLMLRKVLLEVPAADAG